MPSVPYVVTRSLTASSRASAALAAAFSPVILNPEILSVNTYGQTIREDGRDGRSLACCRWLRRIDGRRIRCAITALRREPRRKRTRAVLRDRVFVCALQRL